MTKNRFSSSWIRLVQSHINWRKRLPTCGSLLFPKPWASCTNVRQERSAKHTAPLKDNCALSRKKVNIFGFSFVLWINFGHQRMIRIRPRSLQLNFLMISKRLKFDTFRLSIIAFVSISPSSGGQIIIWLQIIKGFTASEMTVNWCISSRIFLVQSHINLHKCPSVCQHEDFLKLPTLE